MLKASVLTPALVATILSFPGFAHACLDKQDASVDNLIAALSGELEDCQKTRAIEILPAEDQVKEVNFVDLDILFEFDSAVLTPDARQQLDKLGAALASEKLVASDFLVEGHTDASGAAEYNQRLSEARAQSVQAYLSGTRGIDGGRLVVVGKGESDLVYPADPESSVNRRVEIVNLGKAN